MTARERRRRVFLVDYHHPKLGRRTIRIRAARVGQANLAAHRRLAVISRKYLSNARLIGIREP